MGVKKYYSPTGQRWDCSNISAVPPNIIEMTAALVMAALIVDPFQYPVEKFSTKKCPDQCICQTQYCSGDNGVLPIIMEMGIHLWR